MRFKMPQTASKKREKRKITVECEPNSSKIAVMLRKKNQDDLNEIAQQDDFSPKSWRKIRIQVIYKKGEREDAGN